MEPRWKANCQRQCRQNHQDLGLAIWRLPVDADRALGRVSFYFFFLFVFVDSSHDFSQFQGQISGVEPRWKANCQRQCRRNHQDLELAVWRLPVDAVPGQRRLANRIFYISIFSAYIYRKKLRFRVACLMDTPRNKIFLFLCSTF